MNKKMDYEEIQKEVVGEEKEEVYRFESSNPWKKIFPINQPNVVAMIQ